MIIHLIYYTLWSFILIFMGVLIYDFHQENLKKFWTNFKNWIKNNTWIDVQFAIILGAFLSCVAFYYGFNFGTS